MYFIVMCLSSKGENSFLNGNHSVKFNFEIKICISNVKLLIAKLQRSHLTKKKKTNNTDYNEKLFINKFTFILM